MTVNGIPNKIYSQGMKTRDFWEEIFRRFGKENSSLDATDFYTGDRFALFIDLRSMKENNLHGSGLRLVNTKEGVHLMIKRKNVWIRKRKLQYLYPLGRADKHCKQRA